MCDENAQDLTNKWLRLRAKVQYVDVRLPTRIAGSPDMLQVSVFMSTSSWTQVLRANSVDGVSLWHFFENNQNKLVYRARPFPKNTILSAAIRQSQFLGDKAVEKVCHEAGFGIRMKAEHFDEILCNFNQKTLSNSWATKSRFENCRWR